MKLDIQDLRIGNIIKSKLLGTNHLVTGFISRNDKKHLYTDLQESYSDLEDWQGIPLTEKRIEKLLSFKIIEGRTYIFSKECPILYITKKGKCVNLIKKIGVMETKIIYVHDIQNLFRELTKTNLEITL
jgi:hypothetical protein